jgi:hypothetical protein
MRQSRSKSDTCTRQWGTHLPRVIVLSHAPGLMDRLLRLLRLFMSVDMARLHDENTRVYVYNLRY